MLNIYFIELRLYIFFIKISWFSIL